MIEYATAIDIAESPAAVWARLTAFENYPAWNPYQVIEGRAAKGAKIQIATHWGSSSRTNVVKAKITRFEPETALEFVAGWFGFRSRRWFALEAIPKGVRVRHGVVYTGFAADLAFGQTHKIERLKPFYDALGAVLAGRADHRARAENARPGGPNRRQRRAARKTK